MEKLTAHKLHFGKPGIIRLLRVFIDKNTTTSTNEIASRNPKGGDLVCVIPNPNEEHCGVVDIRYDEVANPGPEIKDFSVLARQVGDARQHDISYSLQYCVYHHSVAVGRGYDRAGPEEQCFNVKNIYFQTSRIFRKKLIETIVIFMLLLREKTLFFD